MLKTKYAYTFIDIYACKLLNNTHAHEHTQSYVDRRRHMEETHIRSYIDP